MDMRSKISAALKDTLRSKDQVGTATLRLIMAALKDRDIAARGQGRTDGIEDAEILSMMQSMIKQRHESIETYEKAGRQDLADRERAEIVVIEGFLPRQMNDAEVAAAAEAMIAETGAAGIRDMGKVMAAMKAQYAGQMDMTRASSIVKQKLNAYSDFR